MLTALIFALVLKCVAGMLCMSVLSRFGVAPLVQLSMPKRNDGL